MRNPDCEDIARAFLGPPVKRVGAELYYRCTNPNHCDKDPSLKINVKKNCFGCFVCGITGGPWKLAAFLTGCDANNKAGIRAALVEKGLLSSTPWQHVADYPYAGGKLRKRRFERAVDGKQAKRFVWQHIDQNGAWQNGKNAIKPGLYRWDARAKESDLIFLPEGERKVDVLREKLNLTATCGPDGSNTFTDEDAALFSGKCPTILGDKDAPGLKYGRLQARLLLKAGATTVRFIEALPGVGEHGDIVDWVKAGGTAEQLLELVEKTRPLTSEDVEAWSDATPGSLQRDSEDAGPYLVEQGRISIIKQTPNGPVTVELCNFDARVEEEVILDDGLETNRTFLIKGKLAGGEPLPAVRVPTSRFSGMGWVAEQWGIRAVVKAGNCVRDQLREAIQRLSPHAGRRQVFAHTGFREVSGHWAYLTASGAIGIPGPVEVDLGTALARYQLPQKPQNVLEAIRLSLKLLKVGPPEIMVPLWAGVYRAPLASTYPLDLSIWLEGPTGSLKSSLAALALCHFGEFDRTSLPGSWTSTANLLERRAFILKDALFVIDDYAPSSIDCRELEVKASRLLRAQGNLQGRGRLRSDLSERPEYPPRGLILSTGEQHPPGQSVLARMILTEVEREQIDLAALTQAQDNATSLRHAMSGYVSWLAPQMPKLPEMLREIFQCVRLGATAGGEHLRVPEAVAHLWLGAHYGLEFAQEMRAISHSEAEEYRNQWWEVLLRLGETQSHLVEGEKPTHRFLVVLKTLVTQHRTVLLPKDSPAGDLREDLLGWYDSDYLYFIPHAAFHLVSKFCRETNEPFPVREDRLRRDLEREKVSEPDAGRHTSTVRIGNHTHRVLRLRRSTVDALLEEEFATP